LIMESSIARLSIVESDSKVPYSSNPASKLSIL
jgi:hypothetical protein